MNVYFKGATPIDLVKNGDGEVVYSRNLLLNTALDTDANWAYSKSASLNVAVTTDKIDGINYKKVALPDGKNSGLWGYLSNDSLQNRGVIEPGDELFLGMTAKSTQSISLKLSVSNAQGSVVTLPFKNVGVTESLQELVNNGVASANPPQLAKIEVLTGDAISGATDYWIGKAFLNKGAKGPYTPAPEDITGTTATTAGGGEFS
ncbi:hypothetical protein [Enterococcus nangangensis]|uniref:hypothetical protein n=1 Tax=Enterococcus nangangensis TaxID=2559926 RepID=UPI0010F709A9|nr:hypothetical protein [Enterococcus nangangensis]